MEKLVIRVWYVAVLLTAALIAHVAQAITRQVAEIEDPIRPGATCRVLEPMSFGSYVFQAPSRYDLVFWPLTDPEMIWFCPDSGFAALVGDVEDLTEAEKAGIRATLAGSYRRGSGEVPVFDRLFLVQQSYSVRRKGASFNVLLLRALAFMYEEAGYASWAKVLRAEALESIRRALDGSLGERERLEYLFLCAAYEREFGRQKESDLCLRSLDDALAGSSDERLKGFVDYLSGLRDDIPKIAPGGTLAPVPRGGGR